MLCASGLTVLHTEFFGCSMVLSKIFYKYLINLNIVLIKKSTRFYQIQKKATQEHEVQRNNTRRGTSDSSQLSKFQAKHYKRNYASESRSMTA